MEFAINEEQQLLKKSVRSLAENKLGPGVVDRDEKEYFDPDTFRCMADLGLTGMTIEQIWGGAGMSQLSLAIAVEELSRIDPSAGDTLAVHAGLCAHPISVYGTQYQKETYLPSMATGLKQGAFAVTESNAGSDVMGIETKAKLIDKQWILNGRKIFTTNAAAADIYLIAARTGPKELKDKAISVFIVEKGSPGLSFGKFEKKMGLRGTQICDVIMEDCKIPQDNVLGGVGKGFSIIMESLDGGRIHIAAQAVGIAQGAYERALEYAKTRIQFNKPIIAFQSVAFKLADMALEIEASRLLTYKAAWKKDKGLPYSVDASMAKLKAAQTAMSVANQAIQIHGGHGYIRDCQVERMLRDAKITELYQGTNEVQKLIISTALIKS